MRKGLFRSGILTLVVSFVLGGLAVLASGNESFRCDVQFNCTTIYANPLLAPVNQYWLVFVGLAGMMFFMGVTFTAVGYLAKQTPGVSPKSLEKI